MDKSGWQNTHQLIKLSRSQMSRSKKWNRQTLNKQIITKYSNIFFPPNLHARNRFYCNFFESGQSQAPHGSFIFYRCEYGIFSVWLRRWKRRNLVCNVVTEQALATCCQPSIVSVARLFSSNRKNCSHLYDNFDPITLCDRLKVKKTLEEIGHLDPVSKYLTS